MGTLAPPLAYPCLRRTISGMGYGVVIAAATAHKARRRQLPRFARYGA
ncbi:MAG: hypothetical protein IKV08_04895 [Phascolarctobacterium sp.]|nr:hypothetical protein [Phascolarctobacterium sp.]